MDKNQKNFKIKKTFGIGVLLKLTKNNVDGIKISTDGNKFTSNVSFRELSNAVDNTMQLHNIRLKTS